MKFRKIISVMLIVLMSFTALAQITYTEGRNEGPSDRFTGNVCMLVVFVNTPSHTWTQKQKDAAFEQLNRETADMNAEAKNWGVRLNLTYRWFEYKLSYTPFIDLTTKDVDWYWEIMRDYFHLDNMGALHEYYEKSLEADDTPVVFMFYEDGRSYTYEYGACIWNEEFSVIEFVNCHSHIIQHELLHQYGAIDMYDYNHEGIQALAKDCFTYSVMITSTTKVVDSFTGYLIGWTNSMDRSAARFYNGAQGRR